MISRYSRPAMAAIWTPESRLRIWFEIEAHATDALAELGVVPREAARAIWDADAAAGLGYAHAADHAWAAGDTTPAKENRS